MKSTMHMLLTRTCQAVIQRSIPATLVACEALRYLQEHEFGDYTHYKQGTRRHFSSTLHSTESCRAKRFLSSRHAPLEGPQLLTNEPSLPTIPCYLRDSYWWAYGNPLCIRALDHKFLVNLVLWGNYERLRDACMNELFDNDSLLVNGRTLQVACVYSDFTQNLAKRLLKVSSSLSFDVVDVIPAQLENLKRKLPNAKNVTLTCNDAQHLKFRNDTFHQVVLFFLLHEMPNEVRIQTLRQAMRVLQPGGKLVILDYHEPHSWYWKSIMSGMFRLYEPFAKDLWKHEVEEWLPTSDEYQYNVSKEEYFDGLYQKVVVRKDSVT